MVQVLHRAKHLASQTSDATSLILNVVSQTTHSLEKLTKQIQEQNKCKNLRTIDKCV